MTRWNPSRRSGEARTPPFVRRGGALARRSGRSALPRLSVRLIEWLNHLIPHLWVSGIFIPDSSPGVLVKILHWISQGVLPPSIRALSQRYRSCWVHASTPVGVAPEPLGESRIHAEGYLITGLPLAVSRTRPRNGWVLLELQWLAVPWQSCSCQLRASPLVSIAFLSICAALAVM
jgi:hypothetical protein